MAAKGQRRSGFRIVYGRTALLATLLLAWGGHAAAQTHGVASSAQAAIVQAEDGDAYVEFESEGTAIDQENDHDGFIFFGSAPDRDKRSRDGNGAR